MSDEEYTVCLKISGEASNHVESFIADVRKRADEGRRRYGVDLDIERMELSDEESGFQKASE